MVPADFFACVRFGSTALMGGEDWVFVRHWDATGRVHLKHMDAGERERLAEVLIA